jgi:hypothetical protein
MTLMFCKPNTQLHFASFKMYNRKSKSEMPYLYQILNTVASLILPSSPLRTKFIVIGFFLLHHNRIISFLVSQTK